MSADDVKKLCAEAMAACGAKTREQMVAVLRGSIAVRTVSRWQAGEATDLHVLLLRNLAAGWKPL